MYQKSKNKSQGMKKKDRDKILNNKGKKKKKVCITVVLSIVFGGYLFINAWENAEKAKPERDEKNGIFQIRREKKVKNRMTG